MPGSDVAFSVTVLFGLFWEQLGDVSPVVLKDGLISIVTAKNLWSIFSRDQPCEVQIHGLELLLGPRLRSVRTNVDKEGKVSSAASEGGDGDGLEGSGEGETTYMDIEVGVRAIAQIVEKVLLGLCVKVTNLTVKYEHQQQADGALESDKPVPVCFLLKP